MYSTDILKSTTPDAERRGISPSARIKMIGKILVMLY